MPKAQSTLEYLLIVTVVLLALIYAARTGGPLRSGMENYFSGMETGISAAASGF